MPVDQNLVAEASAATGRVAGLEEELERAKAEYRHAVRRMHLGGASLREIADALGISHQRVHQIVEGKGPRPWRRRRDGGPDVLALCSFCGREQRQVRRLIAGPGVYICDPCIAAAARVSTSGQSAPVEGLRPAPPESDLTCSFCGKRRETVRALVAGPNPEGSSPPAICHECLELCHEILSEPGHS